MRPPVTRPADAISDKRVGPLIVCRLAAPAGAADACRFFLLKDLYVSFMSGNTTSMAAAFARGDFARVRLIGGIIAAFVAGAEPSQSRGRIANGQWSKGGVSAADQLVEITIDHTRSGLQQQVRAVRRPTHRPSFVEAFVHNLVDSGLHQAGGSHERQ